MPRMFSWVKVNYRLSQNHACEGKDFRMKKWTNSQLGVRILKNSCLEVWNKSAGGLLESYPYGWVSEGVGCKTVCRKRFRCGYLPSQHCELVLGALLSKDSYLCLRSHSSTDIHRHDESMLEFKSKNHCVIDGYSTTTPTLNHAHTYSQMGTYLNLWTDQIKQWISL